MTQKRFEIHHEGTEWERIEIKGRWAEWAFESVGKDGDVPIECTSEEGTNTLFLTQDELKQVIAFLQKQVK